MKFIPILFSTPMVGAIKEGRKDVTRRIITKQNSTSTNDDWEKFDFNDAVVDGKGSAMEYLKVARPEDDTRHRIFPKIYPKDVWGDERESGVCLWVRETWVKGCLSEDGEGPVEGESWKYFYRADDEWLKNDWHDENADGPVDSPKWKPSIFMPKDACRYFLEVISVRPERLQDITDADAIREGIEDLTYGEKISFRDYLNNKHPLTAIASFKSLWQFINGEESWNENPWIWRIEYKKINARNHT